MAHRLDDVVAVYADKVAVKLATGSGDGGSLTYKELDNQTNAIAAALMENGVSRGQYVAVYQEPTPDWICSMLAILRIGAVYVPLDPGTPAARLVDRTTGPNSAFEIQTVIDVSTVPVSNVRRIQTVPDAHEPAIALYTSGTTGTPKVIVLTHANFANEVETSIETYGLDSNVTVLQQSAFGFDMSVLQIFLALALGGTLVMVAREFRGDAVAMTEFIIKHKVTYTCATPTEYSSWFRHGDCAALRRSCWTVALSGGEAVSHSLRNAFRRGSWRERERSGSDHGRQERRRCHVRASQRGHRHGAGDIAGVPRGGGGTVGRRQGEGIEEGAVRGSAIFDVDRQS